MRLTALSIAIYLGYVVCIVWALRRETRPVPALLAGIMMLAVGLRVVYPHQYPWGFHDDELKVTIGALTYYCSDRLVGTMLNNMQAGLYAAMIGPVYEVLGIWWAARWYSMVGSTLSVALGYGVARQIGLSPAAAIAGVAIPYAVLPWALLYGRTGLGCEVTLNALIVVFALFKCASAGSKDLVPAAVMLCFGLLLCCFEYTAGKVMLLAAPAALLAFPRRQWLARAAAVIIACAIAAAVYNWMSYGRFAWYGFDASPLPVELRPQTMWRVNLSWLLSALWYPLSDTSVSQSVRAAYVLPLPLVLLVALGIVFGRPRRSIAMLVILLIIGTLPALFGPGGMSSHRLLTAGYVVPFFIAAAIDLVPAGRLRLAAAGLVAVTFLVWGPATYFSDSFWTDYDRMQFCQSDCSLAPPGSPQAVPPRWAGQPVPSRCKDLTSR